MSLLRFTSLILIKAFLIGKKKACQSYGVLTCLTSTLLRSITSNKLIPLHQIQRVLDVFMYNPFDDAFWKLEVLGNGSDFLGFLSIIPWTFRTESCVLMVLGLCAHIFTFSYWSRLDPDQQLPAVFKLQQQRIGWLSEHELSLYHYAVLLKHAFSFAEPTWYPTLSEK